MFGSAAVLRLPPPSSEGMEVPIWLDNKKKLYIYESKLIRRNFVESRRAGGGPGPLESAVVADFAAPITTDKVIWVLNPEP
jgi:hypothetical protein